MRENFRRIMVSWVSLDELLTGLRNDAKIEALRIIEEQALLKNHADALEWLRRDRAELERELDKLEAELEGAKTALAEAKRARAEADAVYKALAGEERTWDKGKLPMAAFAEQERAKSLLEIAQYNFNEKRVRLAEVKRAMEALDIEVSAG